MSKIEFKLPEIAKGNPAINTSKSPTEPDKQKKAAEEFEGLLVQEMLKSMWQTVPKEGLLSGSREEEYYRDMLSESLGQEISKGQGIGIKSVIMKEFGMKSAAAELAAKKDLSKE